MSTIMSISNWSLFNLDNVNLGLLADIESEIDPCDMVSLYFLLHEDPQIALQNLTVYLRVSMDKGGSTCNLLLDWAALAQKRSTWKSELLEALVTCQLYTVIRKLGFDTLSVKCLSRKGSDSNMYIHPMKKIFYALCENLDSEGYNRFKKTIKNLCKSDIPDHESCEVLLLELICRRFFSPVNTGSKMNIEDVNKLINVLENFKCTKSLEMQTIYNKLIKIKDRGQVPIEAFNDEKKLEDFQEKKYVHDFNDSFELFNQLSVEELKNDSAVVFKNNEIM